MFPCYHKKGASSQSAALAVRKSSFFLSTKTLRTLYFSLVYPYLFYCNLVWASTYRTNLIRLEILQKRVIRTIAKTTYDAHTDPIFKILVS